MVTGWLPTTVMQEGTSAVTTDAADDSAFIDGDTFVNDAVESHSILLP